MRGFRRKRRFDKDERSGKLDRLPAAEARVAKTTGKALGSSHAVELRGENQERPILENSTACTMSNAKNPFAV